MTHPSLPRSLGPCAIVFLASLLLSIGPCRTTGGGSSGGGAGGAGTPRIGHTKTGFTATNTSLPTVVTVTPTESSANVSRSTTITATFVGAVQEEPIANALQVVVGTEPVEGSVSYDPALQRVVFTPAHPLPANRTITARAGSKEWSFTTGG